MAWLERLRHRRSIDSGAEEHEGETEATVEWTSPGLATLFDALKKEGSRSILDLGHASNSHLRVLGRFSRTIRFAGLVPSPPRGDAFEAALTGLPPSPRQPYDVVLAWDVMDRLVSHERESLVKRLVELTAPNAWLYAVVDASGAEFARPLRLTLLDLDRVGQEAVGPAEPVAPQLLPGHVVRLFRPFEMQHAFTLRAGRREYVARKMTVLPGANFDGAAVDASMRDSSRSDALIRRYSA